MDRPLSPRGRALARALARDDKPPLLAGPPCAQVRGSDFEEDIRRVWLAPWKYTPGRYKDILPHARPVLRHMRKHGFKNSRRLVAGHRGAVIIAIAVFMIISEATLAQASSRALHPQRGRIHSTFWQGCT